MNLPNKTSKFDPKAYKAKMLIFGILLSFVILSFQNCGQVKTNLESNSNFTIIGKLSSSQQFAAIGQFDPRQPGNGPLLYDIQQNGHVDVRFFEAPNEPITGSCTLKPEHLQQLATFMERASICYFEAPTTPNQICTQEYVYPYARVEAEGITYKLGEGRSGCSDTFELCGADRFPFREFMTTVIEDLNTHCTLN